MILSYIETPEDVKISEISKSNFTLSASRYKRVKIATPNSPKLRELLDRSLNVKDKGLEVGSNNYTKYSPYRFVRTKSLQSDSYLLKLSRQTAPPIMPSSFKSYNLSEGDILISKDSNIGETVILDRDHSDFMLSGGLYRLPISKHKYYVLAITKSDYFRTQLEFLASRGATIRHAKTLFLDCRIPFPSHNKEAVQSYVEMLVKAIISKEKLIKQKHHEIIKKIETELLENQKAKNFVYEYPSINEINTNSRMDAGFYGKEFKKIMFLVRNYTNGFSSLDKQGLTLIPGPSLEIRLLGTRIDSVKPEKGFYRLVTPKQITSYGTVTNFEYIGTDYRIPSLKKGDILFGESGTGRSLVYMDNDNRTITNAHGHVLRPHTSSLDNVITIRCLLAYFKEKGLIDLLTVGGSGGHLSPAYFDRVDIPNFREDMQKELSRLYHNNVSDYQLAKATLSNYLDEDNSWSAQVGIVQLDQSIKKIKLALEETIERIVLDQEVEINFKNLSIEA